MRPLLLIILNLFSLQALASNDFDPAGPSVDWLGQIVAQRLYHEDTCFTLRQSRYATDKNQPEMFVACAFGYFNAPEYQTGRWLKIRGILQPQPPQPPQQPLVGAAWVTPTNAPINPYDDPEMFGYPFAGPFGYPFAYPMPGMWMNPYFPY